MDLRNLDTREKAHEGVDVPLVINGETQIGSDGEPVTFKMRGIADPALKRITTAAYKGAKEPEDFDKAARKVMMAAVIGWSSNWTLDGKVPAFSPETLSAALDIPLIFEALLPEVRNHARFMKRA